MYLRWRGSVSSPAIDMNPLFAAYNQERSFVGKQGVCIVLKLLKGKRKWALLFLPVTAVILLLVSVANPSFAGSTETQRRAFLGQYGWELGEEINRGSVRIPEEFDDVYVQYNEIQLKQGFDLRRYAGKEVERYQYPVTNYPGYPEYIRANLLVFQGKIIGGDISSVALNGFMHGFFNETLENP